MVAHQDEETQQKGIVVIIHCKGNHKKDAEGLKGMGQMNKFRASMPERIVALHWCYEKPEQLREVAIIRALLSRRNRSRFRPHGGEISDQNFELQSYGIPTEHLPIPNSAGDSIKAYHLDWIKRQWVRESSIVPFGYYTAIVPRRFDVLFGKGRTTAEHTGNLRAFLIVEMYRGKYEQANKYEKTEIAERVVRVIQESYGRFLKQEDGGWVEVDPDHAREKISHYFRRLRSIVPSPSSSSTSDGSEESESNGPSATKKQKKVASKRRPSSSQVTSNGTEIKTLAITASAPSNLPPTLVIPSPRYDGQHLLSTESGKRAKVMAV
jgi:hypothetical protein